MRYIKEGALCYLLLLGVIVLTGCAGVNMPFEMEKMTPEQLAALAKIKEANSFCVVVNSPYGRGVAVFMNLDRAVIPNGSITVDEQCKTTVTVSTPPKPAP